MTAYRIRLDTTTNWAVGTTAAVGSYALGASESLHGAWALALLLNLLFLWMEARRYRSYEIVRQRVRLLERGFYLQILGAKPLQAWDSELRQSLQEPRCSMSLLQAVSLRVRRTYLGLMGVIVATWLGKLGLSGPLSETARIGWVPGWATVALGIAFWAALAFLAVLARDVDDE